MSMSPLFDKVQKIVADHLQITKDEVRPELDFIYDLKVDSLAFVELRMKFEDEFDVHISDEEGENIRTVQDAVHYIENHHQSPD